MSHILIEKTVEVATWDEITRQKTIDYWSGKRFKFTETTGDKLFASRGRWLGNLISADMSYTKATLSIEVTDNIISCLMEIDPRLQKRSEWDMAWWQLEMKTFESFLLRGDEQLQLWKEFKNDHKTWIFQANGADPALFGMADFYREKYLK